MSSELEIVYDGYGVAIFGGDDAINDFLAFSDIRTEDGNESLSMGAVLTSGSVFALEASMVSAESGKYLKLTAESAEKIKKAGGLMETDTPGVFHAMVGKTGTDSMSWIQVQGGVKSLATNPAMLMGVAGVMAQLAHQASAEEMKKTLQRIESKIDDVRDAQYSEAVGKIRGAHEVIIDGREVALHGGSLATMWSTVSGAFLDIQQVRAEAEENLRNISEKIQVETKPGNLGDVLREKGQDINRTLALLAYSLQVENDFRIVELNYVAQSEPDKVEQHYLGRRRAQQRRDSRMIADTAKILAHLDEAQQRARTRVILNPFEVKNMMSEIATASTPILEFRRPLNAADEFRALEATPWLMAIRDEEQREAAKQEVLDTVAPVASVAENAKDWASGGGSALAERLSNVKPNLRTFRLRRKKSKDSEPDVDEEP